MRIGFLIMTLLARGRWCGADKPPAAAPGEAEGVVKGEELNGEDRLGRCCGESKLSSAGFAAAAGIVLSAGGRFAAAVMSTRGEAVVGLGIGATTATTGVAAAVGLVNEIAFSGVLVWCLIFAGWCNSSSQAFEIHRFMSHSAQWTEALLSSQISQIALDAAAVAAVLTAAVGGGDEALFAGNSAAVGERIGSWMSGLPPEGIMTDIALEFLPPVGESSFDGPAAEEFDNACNAAETGRPTLLSETIEARAAAATGAAS
jgi:hypothetical protein